MSAQQKSTAELPIEPTAEPTAAQAAPPAEVTAEELDADEAEFRAIRQDLPGVKGVSGAGILAISVGKAPTKNMFFRTHRTWRPIVPIVDHEVGIERHFFAVTSGMVAEYTPATAC